LQTDTTVRGAGIPGEPRVEVSARDPGRRRARRLDRPAQNRPHGPHRPRRRGPYVHSAAI